MKRKILIIIITFFLTNSFSQTKASFNKINPDSCVGFNCGDGFNSKIVANFSEILAKKDYKKIVSYLDSKKEGEKLLAVLVCEKLAKEKIMVLSAENIERIKLIYNSKEKITVCAGCTHFKKSTTTEILNTPNFVHLFFEKWIQNYL